MIFPFVDTLLVFFCREATESSTTGSNIAALAVLISSFVKSVVVLIIEHDVFSPIIMIPGFWYL